jgi:hypothetical protein
VLVPRHRIDDTVSKAIARILADLVIAGIDLLPVAADVAEGSLGRARATGPPVVVGTSR